VGLGFLLGIGCSLFRVTGVIDYPLSLVLSPLFWLLFVVWGAWPGRAVDPVDPGAWLMLGATWLASMAGPAVRSGLGNVCEPIYGLAFMVLGPLFSGAAGMVAGWAVGRLVKRSLWRAGLLLLLLISGLLLVAAEFLLTPHVRFYGWFFGMYHGAIYDEAVRITWPYIWLRVKDSLWILGIVWLLKGGAVEAAAGGEQVTRARRIVVATAFAGALCLLLLSPWLGFTASYVRLNEVLAERHSTEHFVVHTTPGGKAAAVAARVAEDLEFRLWQQEELFGVGAPVEPISVYLYESPGQKERLMGAGKTTIAKPWLGEMHLHSHKAGESLFAHELAHVLLADHADSLLGVPSDFGVLPRPGVMEGAAMAVERGGGRLTLHGWARAMRDIGRLPPLESILDGLSFWSYAGPVAYSASGSFIRYLLESRGSPPFLRLYGGAGFSEAYGEELGSLLEEWHGFLDGQEVSQADLLLAELAFKRPSVFEKVCPHAGARCVEKVRHAVVRGEKSEALGYARRAMSLVEGDVRVGREVGTLLMAGDAVAEASELLGQWGPGEEVGGSLGLMLELWRLDALWLTGLSREANRGYLALQEEPDARVALGVELSWRVLLSGGATSSITRRLLLVPMLPRELEQAVPELLGEGPLKPAFGAVAGRVLAGRPKWEEEGASLMGSALASSGEWLWGSRAAREGILGVEQLCAVEVDLVLRLAQVKTLRGELDEAQLLIDRLGGRADRGLGGLPPLTRCITPGLAESTADLQRRILWKRRNPG